MRKIVAAAARRKGSAAALMVVYLTISTLKTAEQTLSAVVLEQRRARNIRRAI